MSKNAVIMLSGGVDSAVALAESAKYDEVTSLFFDYGQQSADYELAAARRLSRMYKAKLEVFDISNLRHNFIGLKPGISIGVGFAGSVSPNCPFGLFGLASTYAMASEAQVLVSGVHKNDFEELPYATEYFQKYGSEVSKLHVVEFSLDSPFLTISKAEVIKIGEKLGLNFSITRSCTANTNEHCGECLECKKRRIAFKEAGIKDPTVYLSECA